ncbi:DUF362 domain-containing protein [Patescibacteria group bacterium]|nr:DUF362 domain-containing protein [Patescibacteria group bacterium]
MFYQCPKCKKTWQYPIEKCPDCFLKLERVFSEKIKVVAVSRVNIPTPLHPKIPYFVLLLEDDKGRKWVQKSVKEYKAGSEFKIESTQDKNAVAIWRVKYDVLEAIEKVVSLIEKINPAVKTLILPTLIAPRHPYFAQNTSPEVLNQLIKFLIQRGVKKENIKVAAQSFNDFPITASAKKSKFLSVCEKNKVQILDLSQKGFKRLQPTHRPSIPPTHPKTENFIFDVSEEVFKNDLIINLPILKLDKKIGIRGALENLTRFLNKESYLGLKYLYGEQKLILSLKEVLPEILTIADAISIQTPNTFTAFSGLILASFNPLNLDRVMAEVALIDLPEYLKSVNLNKIKIVGREIAEVQYDLKSMI